MPSHAMLEKQQAVPMMFRRHGDTEPKTRGHALGNAKPASFYVRELERQGEDGFSTLENGAAALTISRPFCPNFIAYDKKVLRFGGYFLEAVHESNYENYRVRKCEIMYYLEDNTTMITEPKVENSGILQGNFVKRHRVPMPECDQQGNMQFFSFHHLNVGRELTIYGRTFHFITADPFTRQFLSSQSIFVPQDEELPRDAYTEIRKAHMARETGQDPDANYGKKQYPMKDFMEATLGKFARPSDHLRRFLDHDRHVLRFFAIWDDTEKLYGIKHRYTVHFFLADNTIEILESYERNSGCDPFPKLLNRAKLSKDPAKQACAAVCDEETEESLAKNAQNFYSWEDFVIGKYLQIFNRRILLLDADDSTRQWYEDQHIPLSKAIVVKDDPKAVPPFVPSPHDGFGSEDDSLQSCYHLLPKAPLKSLESLDNTEVLRFRARFDTTQPEDIHRRFIISVIVSDQSVSISEPIQRNAGIVGGKFLERMRVKRCDSTSSVPTPGNSSGRASSSGGNGAYLGLDDFYVGAKVHMCGRTFIIFEMDEYSANYMEAHAAKFPRSDKLVVLRKIRGQLSKQEFLARVAKCKQNPQTRYEVDVEELTALFEGMVADFAHHDAIAIIRGYGKKDAMKIELEMLLQLLV
uniref:DM10 domain-containing protein n=1 Tax=Globisporangium ultimum (strain ATCC 200006 / CBS 805.95 / DAOM BR144) TaxID=431595 RepID=K3X2N2_GLOUD